jgi:hypothetical protein
MRRVVLTFQLFASLLLAACPKNVPGPQTNSLAPSSNVYLRNSFDTDPSSYIGRFVPAGATDLDETSAMPLACSKYITHRFIDGGGVRMTESFNVSTEVGARLDIPVVASGKGQGSSSRQAKVEYELTGKMVAEIADVDGFAACCKAQPDQCSDRYIGEFLEGRGAVYHEAQQSASAGASGLAPASGTSGGADFSHDTSWKRAVEFPNPVYFAFKVTLTPYTQAAVSTCPPWVTQPPVAKEGFYVVGQSGVARTEVAARNQAQNDASRQFVRAAGATVVDYTQLSMPSLRVEQWCVEPQATDRGQRFVAHVLAWVSADDLATFKQAVAASQPSVESPYGAVPPPIRVGDQARPPARPAAAAPVQPQHVDRAPPHRTGAPAPSGDVGALLTALDAASFSADKVTVLHTWAASSRLSVAQAALVLDTFSFSADKLEALRILRPCLTDPQNTYKLLESFTFSADKAAAEQILR